MAYIAPFRALRYDPAQVDLTKVVTQPYDKITPEMQNRYYDADPHNLVRIILGKPQADDRQEKIFTLGQRSFSRIGAGEASSSRIRSHPSTNTFSVFKPPGGARNWNAAVSSPWAGSRTIPPVWCIATSRPWPSLKPTDWSCCAPPGPILDSCSCYTAIRRGRLMERCPLMQVVRKAG